MILLLKSLEVPELVQDVDRAVQVVRGLQRLSLDDSPIFILPIIVRAKNFNELFSIIVELAELKGKEIIVFLFNIALRGPFVELLVVD